jgi:hypothetical protein
MGKPVEAIVAGTGYRNEDGSDRSQIIRRYCRPGSAVRLVREPNNPHDANAVAVFLVYRWLFWTRSAQIGYLKAGRAKKWAGLMDRGIPVNATVRSIFAPEDEKFPRVSMLLEAP